MEAFDRIERKILLSETPFVSSPLSNLLVSDTVYPQGYIFTLYYDTKDFACYFEKSDGHYQRKKFRLRWYQSRRKIAVPNEVYFECKAKQGSRTIKNRTSISSPLCKRGQPWVMENWNWPLSFSEHFNRAEISHRLLPTLLSCYYRQRFFDLHSGSRISLDSRLTLLGVRADIPRPFPLPKELGNTQLLEVKGNSSRLPAILRGIVSRQSTSFSKYAVMMESLWEGN